MTPGLREPVWRAQFGALVRSDGVVAYRTRALHMALLMTALLALPFVLVVPGGFAAVFPGRLPFGFTDAQITGIAAALMAASFLASFTHVRFNSPTLRLLATLPIDRRSVWAFSAWRMWLAMAGLLAFGAVLLAVLAANGLPEVLYRRAFLVEGAIVAVVAVSTAGQLTFVWVKTRPLPVRRAVWAVASVFAVGSPAVYAATRDPVLAGYAAGPWYLPALAIESLSGAGVAGAIAAVAGFAAIALALIGAPVPGFGRAAGGGDAESGILTSFGTAPRAATPPVQSVQRAVLDPDQRGAASQQRAWETVRAGAFARKDDSGFDALDVPEGRLEALRYYLTPTVMKLRQTLASAVVTVVLFAAIWYVGGTIRAPPRGAAPALDIQVLMVLGALVWVATEVAMVVYVGRKLPDPKPEAAPGEGTRKDPAKEGGFARNADRERPRPRPSFIRTWRMLQTVPLDRSEVERSLRPSYWLQVALAAAVPIGAAGVGAAALGASVPLSLLAAALMVAVIAAALAMLGPVTLIDAAVRPNHSLGRRLWRWGIVAAWLLGGLVLVVAALFAGSDAMFGAGLRPGGAVALATLGALSVSLPWIVWKGRVEAHVETQKPFESERRLIALTAAGLALGALSVVSLLMA